MSNDAFDSWQPPDSPWVPDLSFEIPHEDGNPPLVIDSPRALFSHLTCLKWEVIEQSHEGLQLIALNGLFEIAQTLKRLPENHRRSLWLAFHQLIMALMLGPAGHGKQTLEDDSGINPLPCKDPAIHLITYMGSHSSTVSLDQFDRSGKSWSISGRPSKKVRNEAIYKLADTGKTAGQILLDLKDRFPDLTENAVYGVLTRRPKGDSEPPNGR